MSKALIFVCVLFMVQHVVGQSTNISTLLQKKVNKADYLFEHLGYRNALQVYLQQFKNNPQDLHVRERIASCYSLLNDPVSAELWYQSLVAEPGIRSEIMFDYAEVLSRNGKYEEATRWFREYLKQRPEDQIAFRKLNFINSMEIFSANDDRFLLSPFDFNSGYSEFGAQLFHDGLVFASTRDGDFLIKHKPFDSRLDDESLLNLYYARRNEVGGWWEPVPFYTSNKKTNYHEGPITFYKSFQKAAFTTSNASRNKPVYDSDGRANLHIYLADVSRNGELQNVVSFAFNSDAYSNAHPTFTPDGETMYFVSTIPSGLGGSDIFMSTLVNGRWSEPSNVGVRVNTTGDEMFPFIFNDTTLYFSSTGHGGFGGLDIYVSYKRDGEFAPPINVGRPLNTRFDDFSFVCDSLGRSGFIASNDDTGEGHDDIYHFTAKGYLLTGIIHDQGRPTERLADVALSVFNTNGDLVGRTKSDIRGVFRMELLFDQEFFIKTEKEGFASIDRFPLSTRGQPFSFDTLRLSLSKQTLFSRGRVFSNETQSMLPGVTMVLQNLTDVKTDTLALGAKGEYYFAVRPGKRYRIEGRKEGYIANGFNLDTKGMTDGELLNDIVMEEDYLEKQVILFDYAKSEISKESAKVLDRIATILLNDSETTLNVGTHSDARGSYEYNVKLSQKRSESTAKYLVSKGINSTRIHLNWFGEQLVLNQCSDGVTCPEEEHSKNRRAELKVQKKPVN